MFRHYNSDTGHEFYSQVCVYLTESKLDEVDKEQCRQDSDYEEAYPQYLGACDALKHARMARGTYPVVIPVRALRHLRKMFPNKGKGTQVLHDPTRSPSPESAPYPLLMFPTAKYR